MEETMNFGSVITYLLVMLFVFVAGTALGQNLCDSDICVVQFNASWNANNSVDYLDELTDCEVMNLNIDDDDSYQNDFEIVVVPTIIVFNGKEVKRFQANIMMQLEATRREVQDVVDEIIYSDF
tara:strand:+ start:592 stop:963 length:372 start_codon:yes stop_codon:yes gene_type:complete